MMNKYKNRLDEILDDTFELKCRMLFLVANLKNNKNTIYKVSISNYLDKIYNIIEYINKINIKLHGCLYDYLFFIFCKYLTDVVHQIFFEGN